MKNYEITLEVSIDVASCVAEFCRDDVDINELYNPDNDSFNEDSLACYKSDILAQIAVDEGLSFYYLSEYEAPELARDVEAELRDYARRNAQRKTIDSDLLNKMLNVMADTADHYTPHDKQTLEKLIATWRAYLEKKTNAYNISDIFELVEGWHDFLNGVYE